MPTKLRKLSFTGHAFLHRPDEGGLADTLVKITQTLSRQAASAVAATTDNSAGVVGGTPLVLENPLLTARVTAYQGTAAAPKSEVDAAFGNVRNAIATVLAHLNLIAAKVPAFTLTDSTGGTSGAGTIAAIDVSYVAANGAGAVDFASFVTLANLYNNAISQLAYKTNALCYATGSSELTDGSAPAVTSFADTFAALSVTTAASVTGTTTNSISNANAQLIFASYAHNIARIAARVNAMAADITGFGTVDVVAVK